MHVCQEAGETVWRLFGANNFKSELLALQESKKEDVSALENGEEEPRKLKLAAVDVFVTPTTALFDSISILDVLSVALYTRLALVMEKTKRRITMMDSKEKSYVGEFLEEEVMMGPVTTEFSCLVVHKFPY